MFGVSREKIKLFLNFMCRIYDFDNKQQKSFTEMTKMKENAPTCETMCRILPK